MILHKYLGFEMGKQPQSQSQTNMTKSKFILKGSKSTFFKGEVSLTFPQLNNASTIPRLLKDKKCSFPTFYFPSDPRDALRQARNFIRYSQKQ